MGDPLFANWLVLLGAAGAVGGAIASFLNVVAWRLPAGRSVVHPPSACLHCRSAIRPWHNIPVLGWVLLRGRCYDCSEPISARYPLVELLGAAMWAVLFVAIMGAPPLLGQPRDLIGLGLFGAYFSALLAAALIDADHFILPDRITLPLIPLGIAANAALEWAGIGDASFVSSVFGAVAGGGVLIAIAELGRRMYGREAMGFGDVKLVAAIGAWQGLHPTLLLTILVGSLAGSIVGIVRIAKLGRQEGGKIPFGPFLIFGAFVSFVWGDQLWAMFLPTL